MANNRNVLVMLCISTFILSLGVSAEKVNDERINKGSLASKKTKRAIEVDNNNFSNQNDLIQPKTADSSDSNESYPKEDLLRPPSMDKRAPSGFTGMRGKKQQEYTDLSPNDLDWIYDDDDIFGDIRSKKAPSGFNGVRGKKNQYDYEASLLDELLRRLYEESSDRLDSYRLREHLYDDWENSLEKRAPVGFTGMRGKRPLDLPFDGGKRAPNAFFGVRGKRDFKRSAMQQFNSDYFGMRGKKQPGYLGFRNKFVGVRGKKSAASGSTMPRMDSQFLQMPVSSYRGSQRFLVGSPDFLTLKRTPNGFMGMRGKRQINMEDFLDDDL